MSIWPICRILATSRYLDSCENESINCLLQDKHKESFCLYADKQINPERKSKHAFTAKWENCNTALSLEREGKERGGGLCPDRVASLPWQMSCLFWSSVLRALELDFGRTEWLHLS